MDGCSVVARTCDSQTALVCQKVSNMLKQKAVDCLSDKPSKTICRALLKTEYPWHSEITLERVHKNMHEVWTNVYPLLPKSLAELLSSPSNYNHLTTNKRECFLLLDNVRQSIAILSTPSNLQNLSQASTILVDGTFYTAPHLFTMLSTTIHGFHCGWYIPLVFCLPPSKESAVYEAAFHLLEAEMIDVDNFVPTKSAPD